MSIIELLLMMPPFVGIDMNLHAYCYLSRRRTRHVVLESLVGIYLLSNGYYCYGICFCFPSRQCDFVVYLQ